MRLIEFKENGLYHLFGKGTGDQNIFCDDEDKVRFMFLLLYFQSPTPIYNTAWYTKSFLKKGVFPNMLKVKSILKDRTIELLAFSITNKEFHILIKNVAKGTASVYMHRVLTAYSKHYNSKHKKSGHVFDGPFGAIEIHGKEEVVHTSAFIHKLCKEEWSSFEDYRTNTNRWGELLNQKNILKYFDNKKSYEELINKELEKDKIPYFTYNNKNLKKA